MRPALDEQLRMASPMIADAVIVERPEGPVAVLQLDPMLVKARALQQGLSDHSVAAAANDPRVQRLIATLVAEANRDRLEDQHIVSFEVAL